MLDLNGKNTLLKNTVVIVSCFSEYTDSGVWRAFCEKLPFDVIGLTTIENIVGGEVGETMLTVMVLTSDDIAFSVTVSDAVTVEDAAPFEALYAAATADHADIPALMMSFAPLLTGVGSDFYVDTMTKISGNVPNFGSLAVDRNSDYHDSKVMLNGDSWIDRFAILLF